MPEEEYTQGDDPYTDIQISQSDGHKPYHEYEVKVILTGLGRKEVVYNLGPDVLLAIADFVEQNKAYLQKQALADQVRNGKAIAADEADMARIDREWRAYREED